MANNKDVKRGIVLYLDGKEVENNAQNIQREMRKVKKEIDGCTFGSKEYIAATKRYRELNAILQEHKNKLRDVKTENFSLINSVNALWQKWQLAVGVFMAAFAGVSLALSKFRKEMNADEESAANLKALTGLDDNSIAWLEDQARELSTTMDQTGLRIQKTTKEILEAYMLVGSAKPELLQDKEALNATTIEALRLAEAAKMQMKPAVDAVTLTLNQYGASANEASRYVNVLAAGSKFGAAGVESQTAAIVKAGVAASTAKIPIETLVGSIETLAEKGIKDEVAGTGLKTFFLKLEGMADDVRPSVVGLETALDNLRKKNLSTAETQKMFGLEAFTVAKAMIDGADKVREYTAAVTDTNTAVEQAAINSDTANAKLAQMKNEFSEQGKILVKELNPAITRLVSLGMNSTKILVNLTRFMTENKVTVMLATAAITAYVGWVNRKIIIDRLSIFWTDKASLSIANLNRVIRSNPWGAVITALTIVVGLVADYKNRVEQATKASRIMSDVDKETTDNFSHASGVIDKYNAQLRNNNLSIDTRREALRQLKEIVPEYLADLTEEGKLINDNKDAIDKYLVSLEKQVKLKAVQDELSEKYAERRKREKDLQQKQDVEDEKRQANTNAKIAASLSALGSGVSNNGYGAVGKAANSAVNGVQRTTNELNRAIDERRNAASALAETNKDIEALEKELSKSDFVTSSTSGGTGGDGSSGGSTANGKSTSVDRIKQETQAIELEISQRRNILRQEYIDDKKSKEEYNNELIALEVERINRILQIAGLEPEKIAELQGRLQDIVLKAKQDLEGIGVVQSADEDLNAYKQSLQKIEDELRDSIGKLKNARQLGILDEEQYQASMNALWDKYNADTEHAFSKYNEVIRKGSSETEENLKGWKNYFAEAGLDMRDLAEEIGEGIGSALGNAIVGSEDAVRSALKSVLVTLIDAIEKMVIAATVESELLTLTGIGTAAGVANLLKLAGIKVAFEGLKAYVNSWGNKKDEGYAVGGYTGVGGPYEPAGVVHRGEFVANRFALANPAVKNVLDLIDSAQRAGTIANLTADDLSAVGRTNSSISTTASVVANKDPELLALMKATSKALQQINERFSKPIMAYTYANGKGGTLDAQELVERMQKNASR